MIPRYEVLLDTRAGTAVLEVPTLQGPDAAGRRARWTAIYLGWGDVDEVDVLNVAPLPEPHAWSEPATCRTCRAALDADDQGWCSQTCRDEDMAERRAQARRERGR